MPVRILKNAEALRRLEWSSLSAHHLFNLHACMKLYLFPVKCWKMDASFMLCSSEHEAFLMLSACFWHPSYSCPLPKALHCAFILSDVHTSCCPLLYSHLVMENSSILVIWFMNSSITWHEESHHTNSIISIESCFTESHNHSMVSVGRDI